MISSLLNQNIFPFLETHAPWIYILLSFLILAIYFFPKIIKRLRGVEDYICPKCKLGKRNLDTLNSYECAKCRVDLIKNSDESINGLKFFCPHDNCDYRLTPTEKRSMIRKDILSKKNVIRCPRCLKDIFLIKGEYPRQIYNWSPFHTITKTFFLAIAGVFILILALDLSLNLSLLAMLLLAIFSYPTFWYYSNYIHYRESYLATENLEVPKSYTLVNRFKDEVVYGGILVVIIFILLTFMEGG